MKHKLNEIQIPILILIASVIISAAGGCTQIAPKPGLTPTPTNRLEPASGTYFGVNLDWDSDSPALFNQNLGHSAAVFVQFCEFPLREADLISLNNTVMAVASEGGMLMITLEPWNGLASVTAEAAAAFADLTASYNTLGVPVLIRFAHEMNGSWYPWSQQPTAYVKAFQVMADAIHSKAPQSAMLWAPNYGGGYPFKSGPFEIKPESDDYKLLDTNQDGQITMSDDPYLPYYPGDAAVDWVGMSLYHWGNSYPWGENEVPEAGKFSAQLTGSYNGLNGDESSIPDFYEDYFKGHGKPLAIPETAAFYNPELEGAGEFEIKHAWWRQVLDPEMLAAYPGIKMINWFEWNKPENEVGGAMIDWRALGSLPIADQFRADLPLDKLVFAPEK